MERLRQDLLDAVSIEAGRLSLAPEEVNPAAVARRAAEDVEPLGQSRSVAIAVRVTEALPSLTADPDRLRQALGNLLGNAVKFSEAGMVVELDVLSVNGEVHFLVADAGPGVPPGDEPYIFDSFWKNAAGNPTGAGLGLSIVKGIAEAHGGGVRYERRPGGGSLFRLEIPAA